MKRFLSITLALLLILSTVSFAVPNAVNVFDSAAEFVRAAYADTQETAELSADTWENTEKGYKLFVIDFETKNDGTALTSSDYSAITNSRVDATATTKTGGVAVSAVGRTNPNYTVNARVNVKAGSGASLSGTDDKYLTLATAGDSLIFSQLYVGDGTYLFEFETNTVTYNPIRGSYNAGVTPEATAIDGTWYKTAHTAEGVTQASSTSCSSYGTDNIRFHFNTKATMYDNIVVYYQPTGWTPPSDGGGEGEDDGKEETVSWTHPEYGTKLFNMDFETNNDGEAVTAAALSGIDSGRLNTSSTAGIPVSSVGQINPSISEDDYANYRVNLYDGLGMTYSLETVDGKQALSFIAKGSYKPSLYIGGFYDKTGPYTIVIDYKYADSSSGVVHDKIQFASPAAAYYDGALSSGDWTTVPYTLEYTDSDTYNNQRIVFYCDGATDTFTGSERFIIDNVAVYYYDADIDYGEEQEPVENWTHETYGTKLYTMDFDTKNDGTAVTSSDISTITNSRLDNDALAGTLVSGLGRINPAVSSSEAATYRTSLKDTSAVSIKSVDGDNALAFSSTSYYISLFLGGQYDANGIYTIEMNYKYVDSSSGVVHDRLYFHTVNTNFSGTLSSGDWVNVPFEVEYTGTNDFMRIVFYSASGTNYTGAEEYYVDDISVYYKASDTKYVTVNLDANGNEAMSNISVSNVADGTKVYELLSNISNKSNKQFLGLSKTADGETLSAGDVLTLTEDTTLYMKWGNTVSTESKNWTDDEKGYLLYDIDFERDNTYFKNYDKPLSAFGSVNTSIPGSESWHFSGHHYVDAIEGTGSSSYEPLEFDIKSELVDGVYNKYLVVKPDGTSRWPQLMICSYASGSTTYGVFGGRNGIYTIEGDIRVIKADGSTYTYTSQVADMGTYNSATGAYTMTQTSSYGYTYTVGEWATMSGVCDDEAYDGLVRVKPCNQYSALPTAGADEIHFDNLKLYWKPYTVAVTFDNSANSLLENQTVYVSAQGTITVADLKKLVKGSGLKTLKGISQIKGGVLLDDATVISIYDDLTFYTVWEDKDMTGWTDEDYGVLIYDLDFDSATEFTSGDIASEYGRVNPNYRDSENWIITGSYFNDISLEDDGTGNKYLKATVGNTSQYPQVQVNAEKTDSFVFTSGGVYTLIADVKVASSDNFATNTTFTQFSMPLNAATNTGGIWSKVQTPSVWTSSDKTTLSSWTTAYGTFDASGYDGISKAIYCIGYSALPTADKETVYLDNLRLFWKPDKAVLTINPGDNKTCRTHSFAVSTSGITVSEVMARIVDHGDMILKGVSYTRNGEPLSGTITLSSDTTLYALWEETGEVLSDYSIEFEYDESSGNDIILTNHGTNSSGNSYVRDAKGFGKIVFNTEKEHSFTWDSNVKLTTLVSDNIPAGEVKGVMIRLRYQNIPHFDCSCAADVNTHNAEYKTGSSATYSNKSQLFQIYYATTETASLNEKQSLKKTVSIADGDYIEDDWFTIYYDVSENSDFQNFDLDEIRFDFNNSVWDGTEIDIDYIRFIGDKSKAPKTQSASSMKTTDPMGIRHMASLKKELYSEAESFGWIIAREVSLTSAGITSSAFTDEVSTAAGVATLKGYNYGEGAETLIYSQDGANVYYTAMLYNIPNNMYEDVLIARPFVVIDGETYYGTPVAKSVYDVAIALRKGGYKGCTAAQQTYIQRVIDRVEKA